MILSVQHGNEVKGISYRVLVRRAGFQEWEQIFLSVRNECIEIRQDSRKCILSVDCGGKTRRISVDVDIKKGEDTVPLNLECKVDVRVFG